MKNPYVRIIFTSVVNLVLSFLLFSVVLSMLGIKDIHSNPYYIGTYGSIISLLITGVILLIFKKVDKMPIKSMGFGLNRKSIIFMISVAVLMSGITILFLKIFKIDYQFNTEFFWVPSNYLLSLVSSIGWFFGAFHEEVAGRGYFYANLRKYGVAKLLWISSLIFMLLHIPVVGLSPYILFDLFLSGLCFMFIYMKSSSIWVVTIVHAFNNFLIDITLSGMSYSIVKVSKTMPDIYDFYYGVLIDVSLLLITYIFYGKSKSNLYKSI
jgi:uncharacterized protein